MKSLKEFLELSYKIDKEVMDKWDIALLNAYGGKAKNEWGELIGEIVDKVNAGRKGTKYKPVTTGIILKKVKGFDTNQLRDFVTECKKSRCFSECFYGKLKKK